MIVLLAFVLYAAAGIAIAAAFLVFGVTRVLPEPAPVTLGARSVLFPAAIGSPRALAHPGLGGRVGLGDGAGAAAAARCASSTGNGGT